MIRLLSIDVNISEKEFLEKKPVEIIEDLHEKAVNHYINKSNMIAQMAYPVIKDVYEKQGAAYENILVPISDGIKTINVATPLEKTYKTQGKELIKSIEKNVILAMIDDDWKEHLREMDDLKQSVQNAVHEQKDPLLIYKFEAYNLFQSMLLKISKGATGFLMKGMLPVPKNGEIETKQQTNPRHEDMSNLQTSRPDQGGGTSTQDGTNSEENKPKAQPQNSKEKRNITFFEPSVYIGKVIPNYKDTFPATGIHQIYGVSFGNIQKDTNSWAKYYNFPETGISLVYANMGNNQFFGQELSLFPYINFRVFNHLKADYKLKLSLGLSYFTTHFDSIENPKNNVIGSSFTWNFKLFLFRTIIKHASFGLRFGVGFTHDSNGHTQMPNLGANSIVAVLSAQFYKKGENNFDFPKRVKGRNFSPKQYFIGYKQDMGFHEQGNDEGPRTNIKRAVFAYTLNGGVIFNNHIKLRIGFSYRFYQHYYDYLSLNKPPDFNSNYYLSASAIRFILGSEFLMGHFALDTELGYNLYKPFYKKFNNSNKIGIKLRTILTSSLGMNLYLFNTQKSTLKSNFYIGAHMNANLAKADFSSINVGYTYLFR